MKLNELAIKKAIREARMANKNQKVFDGHGLFLMIRPSGSASWKWNYRFEGKQKTLTLGSYPVITLREARQKYFEAKRILENNQDPCTQKQEIKLKRKMATTNTFEHIAREWHRQQLPRWKPDHASNVLKSLEKDAFPKLGNQPLVDIKAPIILTTIRAIESRGVGDTASRVLQRIRSIFNYAIQTGRADENPALCLVGVVVKKTEEHLPALPQMELPEFFRRLNTAYTRPETHIAMLLLILTFVRIGTLRCAEWVEIDIEKCEWRIPKEKMKGRKEAHIVPLSDWAMALLADLHRISGDSTYLFPNAWDSTKPMSSNALGYLMGRMGYKGIATPHGFRSLATDVLNENGFDTDWIERQMAHVERNKVRAAYHRTEYLPQRREMMQWYSDWIKKSFQLALGVEHE